VTIISHRHRLVFIAIPKTGTHSIRFAIRDQLGPEDEEQVALFVQRRIDRPPFTAAPHGHQLAREVREALGAERWARYRSFAVVRNPWERFVSCVAFMMRHTGRFEQDPRGTLRRVLDNPSNQSFVHYRPQSDFVTDVDGKLMVGRICRAERLQADFDALCDEVGLERRALEQRNASNHRRYTDYFDDELAQQVGERYREDVARFGYRFGD
jgi:hypothetical protein